MLEKHRFILAIQADFIAFRRMTLSEIAEFFGLSLRTVKYHKTDLSVYYIDRNIIPENRICEALREAKLVINAFGSNEIPGVPDNVLQVLAATPADLVFKLSDKELKDFLVHLEPHITKLDARGAELTLRDINKHNYEPNIKHCQEQMKKTI